MGEHLIDPQFQQGRCAVPVHRVLEDDKFCLFHRSLFRLDVDIEVGVKRVERTYDHVRVVRHSLEHLLVDPRFVGVGVRINDKNHR
ncbi:hypothetical protein D3C78_1386090 [compost metagenome]